MKRAVTHAAYPTRLSMRLLWHFVIHQIQSVGFRGAENRFLLCAPKSAPWKQLFRCGADYWMSFLRRANHRSPFAPPRPLAILQITGLSPNDRVLLSSPLKSLSHSFPTHSPTTKKPSYCGADRGGKKRHRQDFGGKRPRFLPGSSSCRSSEESYFCFRLPLTLFVCVRWCRGRFMLPFPCFEKEKDTICFHTRPPWPQLGPCYFWKDPNAGLCWDCWVYIIVLPKKFLLSGVDNASGQYLDYATAKLCWIHYRSFRCFCSRVRRLRMIFMCVRVSSGGHCGRQAADSKPGDWAALSTCAHR